jgi:hypothetical protein
MQETYSSKPPQRRSKLWRYQVALQRTLLAHHTTTSVTARTEIDNRPQQMARPAAAPGRASGLCA